ncbi:sigma 54-interacting transcriptional regulator [Clostridium sp. WLY-B-L2]|mgnify:CR=1 FL=1|uniref:Sigma 54-interacting transcriptional regulator n=1 Tax=Clostridium aromativorans TaxID=2836848 RepID=A0ABS8N9Q9_9CLOT|nr:sigma 54-interacting transcriptional regulator [Clostridium sp. HV4-5-A1G]MCC9296556.1 sigma 54-interacting transcriptional regulator [Clostridium aromativorans]CAB1261877.1 Signal-transduction and transcriptional-control protein [Clostridiaceae bacterium BL-3]
MLRENEKLIKIAVPFMKVLYKFLKDSGFSLYLIDKNGIVLTIIGDKDVIEDEKKMGIVEGADMSERSTGTNAIGVALYEDCAVQISGEEHFITTYYTWTCSADIIHDVKGNVIGCLNLTGRRQLEHPHTLGLVAASVRYVENQLKVEKTQYELFQAHQYMDKVINSINSGIIAVDNNGKIRAINNSACELLYVKKEVVGENIDSILNNWVYIFKELKEGRLYENREIIYSHEDKKQRLNLNVYPIRDRNGAVIGMVAMFRNMNKVYNLVNKYIGKTATYTFDDLIGESDIVLKLIEQSKEVADSPSTVLIQGESGTGKELIAQSIHNGSKRKNYPFVVVNCGAIPENLIESELFGYEEGAFTGARKGGRAGKFELSDGGTLFLDEIGEMPLDMQVNLLRVLQEGCVTRIGGNRCIAVDVRIIAATNKDLKQEVERGNFREDLYYRLSVIPLYVPPLRDRGNDVKILINHFLKVKSLKLKKPIPKINPELYQKILNYNWPGNVRELENCIENIVNMNGNTSFEFKDSDFRETQISCKEENFEYDMYSLDQWDKIAIVDCLHKCNFNITKAAKILKINRSTLYTKIRKFDIKIR